MQKTEGSKFKISSPIKLTSAFFSEIQLLVGIMIFSFKQKDSTYQANNNQIERANQNKGKRIEISQCFTSKFVFLKIVLQLQLQDKRFGHYHSLRRSIPAFLATASSPFFFMAFNALVDKRNFTQRLPASHQTFLYWRLTNCNFLVLWFEKETLLALFAFLPVKGHTLPEEID